MGKECTATAKSLFNYLPGDAVNNFNCKKIFNTDILVRNPGGNIRVIEAYEGELLTKEMFSETGMTEFVESDTEGDILKIVVKDRYKDLSACCRIH